MSAPVSVLSATSRPWIVELRMSKPRIELFRTSNVRIVLLRMSALETELFLISRLSMDPVASPYDTPPSDRNSVMHATTSAGDGRRRRMDFTDAHLLDLAFAQERNTVAAGSERTGSGAPAGRRTTKRAPPPGASCSSTAP